MASCIPPKPQCAMWPVHCPELESVRLAHGMLDGVHLGHGTKAAQVSIADEVAGIAVQRAVSIGVHQEGNHSPADVLKGPGWAPVGLEDVEADLTVLQVYVGMENLRHKAHLWGRQWVVC